MIRVIVPTSDRYAWLLPGFSYLFNTFWSQQQPVVVGGFTPPPYSLPANFEFVRVMRADPGPNRWSDALIQFLTLIQDEFVIILLEDYYLTRTVDHEAVRSLGEYMADRPEVVRMDLTADRLYAGNMRDVEGWGRLDIIETPADSQYNMSLQAAIWRKSLLLQLLVAGRSSWETEIYCNPVMAGMRVLGTRSWPVRYANIMYQGKLDPPQVERIPEPHRGVIRQWIKE